MATDISTNFDDIKSSLQTYLSSQPQFSDYNFAGATLNVLVSLLAYNTYMSNVYSSMGLNEAFLDTAQLRNSVISKAKPLGYVPASATSASTTLSVKLFPTGSPATVSVPKYTKFTTSIDDTTYTFQTTEETTVAAVDGEYTTDVTLYEGSYITVTETYDTDVPIITIDNELVDHSSIEVSVTEPAGVDEIYTAASDLTVLDSESKVFFVQELFDNTSGIYFGDGVLCYQPLTNSTVTITYRICSGDAPNDATTFSGPSAIDGNSFTFTVNESSSGGAGVESISSIKFNAPQFYATQNRAVTYLDYRTLIKRENPDLTSVNVWGGEDNTPPQYGKVYVSTKPNSGNVLSDSRKEAIATQMKTYNIGSIGVEVVDANFLFITPDIQVTYDSSSVTMTAAELLSDVHTVVQDYETDSLVDFDTEFDESELTYLIKNMGVKVSVDIDFVMQKRFVPTYGSSATYTLSYNNEIDNTNAGTVTSNTFEYDSHTCKLKDDGDGNVYAYYEADAQEITIGNIGTVDYENGTVTLTNINVTGSDNTYFEIYAVPVKNTVSSVRNQILMIADGSINILNQNEVSKASLSSLDTLGTTTEVDETGIQLVTY